MGSVVVRGSEPRVFAVRAASRLGVVSCVAALLLGSLSINCGGPGSGGQGVKTADEMLEEQLAEDAERQKKNTDDGSDYVPEESDEDKKAQFDQRQAELELIRAARSAKTCVGVVTVDGPRGKAKVTLTFSNDGNVKASDISSPFKDTPLGKCILNAMAAVIVPPFTGSEHTLDWEIDLDEAPEAE